MQNVLQQNNNAEKIGKMFIKINDYIDNIYGPLYSINSTFDRNSFFNISFNNPYSIQFDTVFLFEKDDINSAFKDLPTNDIQQLKTILNKNYGISDKTQYPIKIRYFDIIKLMQSVANDKKISGLCQKNCLEMLNRKILEKKASRSKISSRISNTTFGLGIFSTLVACAGFFVASPATGIFGLCLMGFFTTITVSRGVANMINEIKKQNNSDMIEDMVKKIKSTKEMIEAKIGNLPNDDNNKNQNNEHKEKINTVNNDKYVVDDKSNVVDEKKNEQIDEKSNILPDTEEKTEEKKIEKNDEIVVPSNDDTKDKHQKNINIDIKNDEKKVEHKEQLISPPYNFNKNNIPLNDNNSNNIDDKKTDNTGIESNIDIGNLLKNFNKKEEEKKNDKNLNKENDNEEEQNKKQQNNTDKKEKKEMIDSLKTINEKKNNNVQQDI